MRTLFTISDTTARFALSALAASVVCASPAMSTAQEAVREACRPEITRAACGAFWLTEAELAFNLASETRGADFFPNVEVGRLTTVGDRSALGLSGFFGWNDGPRLGAKLRMRRWLNDDFSLDVAPGLQFAGSLPEGGTLPALSSHVGVNYRDQLSLTLNGESYDDIHGTQTYYYAGVRFGSKPGRIAFISGSAGILVAFIAFVFSNEN